MIFLSIQHTTQDRTGQVWTVEWTNTCIISVKKNTLNYFQSFTEIMAPKKYQIKVRCFNWNKLVHVKSDIFMFPPPRAAVFDCARRRGCPTLWLAGSTGAPPWLADSYRPSVIGCRPRGSKKEESRSQSLSQHICISPNQIFSLDSHSASDLTV